MERVGRPIRARRDREAARRDRDPMICEVCERRYVVRSDDSVSNRLLCLECLSEAGLAEVRGAAESEE